MLSPPSLLALHDFSRTPQERFSWALEARLTCAGSRQTIAGFALLDACSAMPLRTSRTSLIELQPGSVILLGVLVSSCCGDVPAMETSYTEQFMKQQCGNGTVEEWEECDDGPANNDDGPCSNQCIRVGCGDGLLDDGEECDFGDQNVDVDYGGGCSLRCTVLPECGDGVVDEVGGEACDDGNADDNDACLSTCKAAECGDGEVWAGSEECDDGNDVNTDECTNECKSPGCGNGVVEGDEECDDGNQDETDACLSTCVDARCGDGHVQPVLDEECDDGNDDAEDGCNACARDRVVFVSSMTFQGGDFASLDGADAECRFLAESAELENATTYRAWLSTNDGESPATRFHQSNGVYKLLDDRVVALNWDDLTDGQIWTVIDVTEQSEQIAGSLVWSNTGADGSTAENPADCEGWTMSGIEAEGRRGTFLSIDSEWTDLMIGNPGLCGASAHLYCFEQ